MGLDMFLTAKKDLLNLPFKKDDNRKDENIIIDYSEYGVESITFNVCQWRKAYAIDNWFTENTLFVDECEKYLVTTDKMEELIDICKEVLANKDKASQLLPVHDLQSYEGERYDSFYFFDLNFTADKLEKILKEPAFKGCTFYYTASY